jgi:HlyD family type I secretion membrane fusion protein
MVETIFVRDGDRVRPGAPLLALRRVQSQADVEALLDRRRARLAEAARLEAELSGATAIGFPAALRRDAAAAAAMDAETRILAAREAMSTAKKRMLRQRIVQLEEQIVGFESQRQSAQAQLALYEEEIAGKSTLFAQGLTPKMEMLRLERESAQLRGYQGEYAASIAQARQQIGETELELLAADAERMEKVALRAGELRSELAELDQELAARQDVLTRTVLTAPVEGVVNNLRIKTVGGVIGAGEVVLDIVPTEEKLVLDVEVAPVDIDVVEVGMDALVNLTALSSRVTPRITGTVVAVSAEPILDPNTNRPLTVGMPAEVVIVAAERTMLDYLAQPFVDALRRAGREV